MRQGSGRKIVSGSALVLAGVFLAGGSSFAQATATNTLPDAQIEANVLKALASAPQLANENITTNTVFGTVTLSGSVKDEPQRQMAENLVAKATGVVKVVDELTLGASNDPSQSSQSGNQSDTSGNQPYPPADSPDWGPAGPPKQLNQGNPQQNDSSSAAQQDPQYRQPYNSANDAPAASGGPGPNGSRPYAQNYNRANAPVPYGAQQAGQHVTVPSGSLIRIRINEGLDSKHTQPGTLFDAVVLNDVVADGAIAIPRGASVQGTVVDSKSGGVLKGHGEIALRLNTVTLGGTPYPIVSDTWARDSSDKGNQTVGNAVGLGAVGALIGAVAGGGAGAAIGAGAGVGAGIGSSAASGSRQVLIPSEAILTFHLAQPAPLTTISQAEMDRLAYSVPAGGPPQMRRRYPPPPPPGYYPY